jgi:hypothetical protein
MGLNDVLAHSVSRRAFFTPESRLCPGGDHKKALVWRRLLCEDLARADPLAVAFCVSPLAYAGFALLEWAYGPALSRHASEVFPWRVEASLFALQSVLSFLSDVVWFGVRPPLRLGVLDRISALALVVLQLVKFFLHSFSLCGFTHGLTLEIVGAYCLTPVVVSIFMRGKQAAIHSERRLFLLCHTGWHVAAPVAFAAYIWASLRVG